MALETQADVVTATIVPEEQRIGCLPHYFGAKVTRAEFMVYDWMGALAPGYSGGHRHF